MASVTEFEARPFTAHDGLVEGYERFDYAVPIPPRPEQVGLFDQQPAILEHTERMRYLVGFPANIAGDPARGVVSLGDGGQHRMVQRRVAYLGLLGQQVTGFPEERGLRIQHGPGHPRIKVVKVRGGVFPYQFPPVRGRSAHQRMHEHGQLRVGNRPEPCGIPVAEGMDDQLETCPSPQRRRSGKQATHHRHCGAAEEQPCPAR